MMLLSAATLFADTNLDPEDFLYLTTMNKVFYPELDYNTNPAFLGNVNETFAIGNLEFAGSLDIETLTRIDDSIGVKGGTEETTVLNLKPLADFVFFTLLKNKSVFGFGLNYQSTHYLERIYDSEYNGVSQDLQKELFDNTFEAGVDLYFSPKISGGLSLGFALGYDFSHDPALFNWITDSTVDPALTYPDTLAVPDNTSDFGHGIDAAVGLIFPADSGELRLSVDYQGEYVDRNNEYIEVDTDGDGFNDTIYSVADYYYLTSDKGGPAETVSGYSFEHYTLSNIVDLNAGIVWKFGEGSSVIVDGSWRPFGLVYEHYSEHIITESVDTDVSYLDTSVNSGLGTFEAGLAFDFYDKKNKVIFRIGAGYYHYSESLHQEGDNDAGLLLFSTSNTGNYEELELGLEPENNSLVEAGIDPAEQVVHGAYIDACWRWTPEKKVTLFLDLGVAAYYDVSTYKAYNLNTLSVWEETVSSANIDLLLSSVAGVSIPISDKMALMVDVSGLGFIGDFSFADETHMYDTDLLSYSSDGTVDLVDDFSINTELDICFKWSW